MAEVTRILNELEGGDERAAERLLAAVYDELRTLAAHRLEREPPGQTLQATELVHEAWLRLVGDERADWKGRAYFFAASAEAMRRILVERARSKARLKHGGALKRVELDEAELAVGPGEVDLLALDEALERLAAEDAAKAKLVELRYFAGLTVPEAARVLGVSRATAERWWTYARAFLFHELREG